MLAHQIKDYHEPMWFLGTDILSGVDLFVMDKGIDVDFHREYGAIYCVNKVFRDYSNNFRDIMKEAKRRKYDWVFFDRDIQTQFIN